MLQGHIPNTSNFVTSESLDLKVKQVVDKIPDIAGLTKTSDLTNLGTKNSLKEVTDKIPTLATQNELKVVSDRIKNLGTTAALNLVKAKILKNDNLVTKANVTAAIKTGINKIPNTEKFVKNTDFSMLEAKVTTALSRVRSFEITEGSRTQEQLIRV